MQTIKDKEAYRKKNRLNNNNKLIDKNVNKTKAAENTMVFPLVDLNRFGVCRIVMDIFKTWAWHGELSALRNEIIGYNGH